MRYQSADAPDGTERRLVILRYRDTLGNISNCEGDIFFHGTRSHDSIAQKLTEINFSIGQTERANRLLARTGALRRAIALRCSADSLLLCSPYLSSFARTSLAPSAIAFILPNAMSRGRYLRPQSGAMTMRAAST